MLVYVEDVTDYTKSDIVAVISNMRPLYGTAFLGRDEKANLILVMFNICSVNVDLNYTNSQLTVYIKIQAINWEARLENCLVFNRLTDMELLESSVAELLPKELGLLNKVLAFNKKLIGG